LSALSRAYAIQRAAEGEKMTEEQLTWLANAQRSCEQLQQALGSWPRLKAFLATTLPTVLGLPFAKYVFPTLRDSVMRLPPLDLFVQQISGSTNFFFDKLIELGVLYPIFLSLYITGIAWFLISLLEHAFIIKRELLFPGVTATEAYSLRPHHRLLWLLYYYPRSKKVPSPCNGPSNNTYAAEDRLFSYGLEMRKPPELPLDKLVGITNSFAAGVSFLVIWWPWLSMLYATSSWDLVYVLPIAFFGLDFFIGMHFYRVGLRDRRWR
jgi:hypothetical protein